MNSPFDELRHWIGVWVGRGESRSGTPILIRTEVFGALENTAMGFHIEGFDAEGEVLRHGIRAVLAVAPSGTQRAVVYSTVHGMFLPERTPDDEGVVALSGKSAAGNDVTMTFVEEGHDHILFTGAWRTSDEGMDTKATPRMTCRLARVHPQARSVV